MMDAASECGSDQDDCYRSVHGHISSVVAAKRKSHTDIIPERREALGRARRIIGESSKRND
jgi:hypothetical protein